MASLFLYCSVLVRGYAFPINSFLNLVVAGLLQMFEIILNLVVLICAAATQSASAGFASIGGFGSAYYYNMGYSNSGFLNHEVQQI